MGTIWFDEEPYPGPDTYPTFSDVRDVYVRLGKQIVAALQPALRGASLVMQEWDEALRQASAGTHGFSMDDLTPAPHIPAVPKINPTPHGPPVKRQWDRKGRRTC